MGAEKATLRLGGIPLLEIATRKALALTQEVHVVGARAKFGEDAIEDVFPGQGPLGGIHAALCSTSTEMNLVLAVDVPFVPVEFLRFLRRRAESCSALVVVPRSRHGWQPLCAIYRQGFREAAEQALKAADNKIDMLFARVAIQIIDEQEVQDAGFSPAIFDNLNTPEELARAQTRLRKEQS